MPNNVVGNSVAKPALTTCVAATTGGVATPTITVHPPTGARAIVEALSVVVVAAAVAPVVGPAPLMCEQHIYGFDVNPLLPIVGDQCKFLFWNAKCHHSVC
ncbi:hypothetical protein TIFTF001_000964 [Ficus carica]|uniref:Uncharacterized protein n=1 Tax=Ficus carica TaxID=3494 RepID=A0AA88CQC6_FICCA|nr:hypothetical protein TIFTF001_000964 [Ficus carica]